MKAEGTRGGIQRKPASASRTLSQRRTGRAQVPQRLVTTRVECCPRGRFLRDSEPGPIRGLVPQAPLAGMSQTPDPQEERGVSTQVRHREPLLSVRVLRMLPTPRFAMPAQGQPSRRRLPAQPGLLCKLLRTKPFKDHFKKNTVSDYVVKIQTRIENVF